MITRLIEAKIVDWIMEDPEHKNVLMIDGVRQVGKSTAIDQALKKTKKAFLKINLETQKAFRQELDQTQSFHEFEKLLKREFNFSPGQDCILFIDEANESLQLANYIREMKETWVHQSSILSGSLMLRFFRDSSIRIPVGRMDHLTITPFSFIEFLLANEQTSSSIQQFGVSEDLNSATKIKQMTLGEHQNLLKLLDHYLNCGGMPQIVLQYLTSSGDEALAPLFNYYLEELKEDFLKIYSKEYANLFHRTISSVANLLAQPYKITALVQNKHKLASNILSLFENWKFIFKIEQKGGQPTQSNHFYPKRYLFDVGISKNKREMGIPSINLLKTLNAKQREPLGGLMEQLVCQELILNYPDLCGFKGRNYEIDFMIKTNQGMIPIECKASLKANKNQYRSLDLYNQQYQNTQAVIVSLAPYSQVKRDGYTLHHIPVYALNCLFEFLKEPSKTIR